MRKTSLGLLCILMGLAWVAQLGLGGRVLAGPESPGQSPSPHATPQSGQNRLPQAGPNPAQNLPPQQGPNPAQNLPPQQGPNPAQNLPPQQGPNPAQNLPPQQGTKPTQNMPQQQGPNARRGGLDHALPAEKAGIKLEPKPIVTKEGRRGWRVAIPGGHPLATPAWQDGILYLGGGFGSHEFYAIDAVTGRLVWLYRTGDDGPTAAVCVGDFVAFNTESCELEILTPRGKRLWKKWLGDPLMSMPAIERGRVFMCYPDSRGDRRHRLACFDAASGREYWKQPIDGEIITAPVVVEGHVYLTTLDGLVYCFLAESGKLEWSEKRDATSSPTVWKGQIWYSQRHESSAREQGKDVKRQNEQLMTRDATKAQAPNQVLAGTTAPADYLDYHARAGGANEARKQRIDSTVGFGGSKGDSRMHQAQRNLGEGSVFGVWAYQGSRPFVYKERLYSTMGDVVKCVDPGSGKAIWQYTVPRPAKAEAGDRGLLPPAIVHGKAFVATSHGELICLSASSGKRLWSVSLGEPVAFQPVVARGRVYVPTASGSLFMFETGDALDDGWYMWGARANHDGHAER